MKQAIWKYTLAPGKTVLSMPKGSKPLCVKTQFNDVSMYLWALVEPDELLEERTFFSIGTGHQIEDARILGTYIGTVKLHDDAIIAHVFEALR